MLKINELEDLGYTIATDPDQAGLFLWSNDQEGCEASFRTMDEAQADASRDAFQTFEISKCDNCGRLHNEETLESIRKLSERTEPGGTMPSGQCSNPECGALCYPFSEAQSDGVLTRKNVLEQITLELSRRTDEALLKVHNELCLVDLVMAGEGEFKPAPKKLRYVSSSGYEHIFTGKTPSVTRWVFDRETETLVFAQLQYVIGWVTLTVDEVKDLQEDIDHNDAVDKVEDFSLTESATLPAWAS